MFTWERLILASASPRRRELLTGAGIRFEVQPAQVQEFEEPDAEPSALVSHNAQLKANAIAEVYPSELILGSDTTVCLRNRVLNKPADMDEARAMLRALSGQTHVVYTAVALRCMAKAVDELFVEQSEVTFRPLSEATISAYFQVVNPLDKAGAYGIQEGRELIIERFDGSLSNIMGLPIERVVEVLATLGTLEALRR